MIRGFSARLEYLCLSALVGAAAFGFTNGVLGGGYCPFPSEIDSSSGLCKNANRALGPFPQAMFEQCKKEGGGDACLENEWSFGFAKRLRGSERCPHGSSWERELQVCYEGQFAFGPFPSYLVGLCIKTNGQDGCLSLKWPLTWVASLDRNRIQEGEAILAEKFLLPHPQILREDEEKKLWATWYYLPDVMAVGDGYPLRGMDGQELGIKLSHEDFCVAAMEGSVRVKTVDGSLTSFNFAGVTDDHFVDCSPFYKHRTGRIKFRTAYGPFGDGVDPYILSPFRSLAVDPEVIPFGRVVFIPAARGVLIPSPSGQNIRHDGYFFSSDQGGAIRGKHIDVFLGLTTSNPFPFVRSRPEPLFLAYLMAGQTPFFEALLSQHSR